jgi:hypothetical protein
MNVDEYGAVSGPVGIGLMSRLQIHRRQKKASSPLSIISVLLKEAMTFGASILCLDKLSMACFLLTLVP